jgi:Cys-tRNA synthase (O-phospho-L-seryl-tRNA:Cys-tRNA synthase)
MVSSPEKGRRGKGKRRQGARHGEREGCKRGLLGAAGCWGLLCCVLHSVREKLNVRKRIRRKERRKRKGRKTKEKMEKISNMKIFGEKNKRQFMKLVKNIFVQESYMSNYN